MSWDNEAEEKKNKKKAKKFERQRMADMRDVLATNQGKNVIWELMESGNLLGNIPLMDEAGTQRALGRQEMAKDIYNWIMEASPQEFLNMLQIRAKQFNEFEEDDGTEEAEDS